MPWYFRGSRRSISHAKYQRCVVQFYRNVFSVVPRSKGELVAKMLKANAQESKSAAMAKAQDVAATLREIKLKEAAKKVEDSIEETLTIPHSRLNTGKGSEPTT